MEYTLSPMKPADFLSHLYENKDDEQWILIWTPQDKLSHWFDNIKEAAKFIEKKKKDKQTIYYQAGLAGQKYESYQRCMQDEKELRPVIAMPALYTDIDMYHEDPNVRKSGKNLPRTLDEVMDILNVIPVLPTITVHSGYGIQPLWIFKEPEELADEGARNVFRAYLRRLNKAILDRHKDKGLANDSVVNIDKLLRVVGSYNDKIKNKPVKVQIINEMSSFAKYSLEDFDGILPQDPGEKDATESKLQCVEQINVNGSLSQIVTDNDGNQMIMDPNRRPSDEMLQAFLDIDPSNRATWEFKNPKLMKQSTSEYHLSLSVRAANCGWSRQEIMDLIMFWHKKHGISLDKYIERPRLIAGYVFGKVKKQIEEVESLEALEQSNLARGTKNENKYDRSLILGALEKRLGLKIQRIIKYMQDQPYYRLFIDGFDPLEMEVVDYIIDQEKFRKKITSHTNVFIHRRKDTEWAPVAEAMINLVENVAVSPESTVEGETKAWVREYVDTCGMDKWDAAYGQKLPFVEDGIWHIYLNTFHMWVTRHTKVTRKQLAVQLTMLGCRPIRKQFYIDGKNLQRRTWSIPYKVASTGGASTGDHFNELDMDGIENVVEIKNEFKN